MLYFHSISVLFFTRTLKRSYLITVLKMEFVVCKRGKTMLIFDRFKYVFGYRSQTNVIQWKYFFKFFKT
jgi:hypothetical protein